MLSYASGEFHVNRRHIEAAALDSKVSVPVQSGRQGRHYRFQITMMSLSFVAVALVGSYQ